MVGNQRDKYKNEHTSEFNSGISSRKFSFTRATLSSLYCKTYDREKVFPMERMVTVLAFGTSNEERFKDFSVREISESKKNNGTEGSEYESKNTRDEENHFWILFNKG